ncbi:MAG TPA: transglycosylase family protein [Solirubrobacteraceae bacterium]|nr:transglycosylase family protein [Solirubrobacteraceae bacterium]
MASNRDLSSPVPWRRSLRASQARRATRARRRRLALRGRAGITLAVVLSAIAAGGALAQDAATPLAPGVQSTDSVRALQKKLGVKADGVYGPRTRAAVKRFQRANGLDVDGVAGPQTLAALGLGSGDESPASDETASTTAGGGDDATLERIAQCESGGDPTAVSADGTYRGKYQFDRETWRQMGGSGDPAEAPEAEQDRIAAKLLATRGTAPWPNCGAALS